MNSRDPAIDSLGIEVIEVTEGRAVATMTVTESMLNSHGVCHGGIIFLLADTTMDYASNSGAGVAFAAHGEVDYVRPSVRYDFKEGVTGEVYYQRRENESSDAGFGYESNQLGVRMGFDF